jgi:hypothetical protein
MCALISSTNLAERFLILQRLQRDIIINVRRSSSKAHSKDFRKKNTQIPNFMKIRPVGAEFSHTDGRTDRQT